jgi:phospholipid-binding lipoprotein MlaA
MKRLCVLLLFLISVAFASDTNSPPPSTGTRSIVTPMSDSEGKEFRDPFEKESESKGASVSDPLQTVNRAFFKFNDRLYFWVLRPVAKGYNKVAPQPFRESIKRAFVNLRYPVRVVNNVLQGKMTGAAIETARFVINSTVGIAGLFDPAEDEWRLHSHIEDLDQTLGFYHVPPGWYLTLPIFGPSSVRGTVGMVGDSFLSPWNYVDSAVVVYGSRLFDTINATSLQLGEYESFINGSIDPYVALRDAYTDNRRSMIQR